jgi:GNAT superfamily N-acetyltransferase
MVEGTLKLKPVAVESLAQVENVRLIRNACRAYMTRHTESIGPAQQVEWWTHLDRSTNKLFIYDVEGQEEGIVWRADAGYGLCRLIGDGWWVSGGLGAEWQGKGLGKQLFGHLLSVTGKPCWLEVLEHNTRAYNTYKRLGFVETGRDSGVITMSAT